MKKNLAIFDVDKTMFPGYSIIDFAEFLAKNELFKMEEWREFERLIGEYKKGSFGYNDFAVLIVDSYARGIVGQGVEEVNNLSNIFWQERITTIYGYVRPLLHDLFRENVEIIVVSGSTKESVWPMMDKLKIGKSYCTEIANDGGVYTDQVVVNVASHEGKSKVIKTILDDIGGDVKTYGFGDSVADLSFLELVDNPVVIGTHDKELEEVARREGWKIILNPNSERVEL